MALLMEAFQQENTDRHNVMQLIMEQRNFKVPKVVLFDNQSCDIFSMCVYLKIVASKSKIVGHIAPTY